MLHLFISDLHLDPGRDDITDAFISFLENEAQRAESLYILGDLFEVWLGDDDDSDFNILIVEALQKLQTPIYIMHGNRDFLLGQDFCQRAGATLLPDPTVREFNGHRILLMHGDSLCTGDEEYMKVRKMLRNPAVQADLLSKPLAERAAIARGVRAKSKEHTRETSDDIMDVTPDEVVKQMHKHEVNLMIHGHTHRPAIHDVADGQLTRIVLGDWDRKGWLLQLEDSHHYDLRSFDI